MCRTGVRVPNYTPPVAMDGYTCGVNESKVNRGCCSSIPGSPESVVVLAAGATPFNADVELIIESEKLLEASGEIYLLEL